MVLLREKTIMSILTWAASWVVAEPKPVPMDKLENEQNSMDSQDSLVHIKANELYPKKEPIIEDGCQNVSVPFPMLSGEYADYIGRTTDGIIIISNYRLFVQFKHHFYNIPLGLIELVECREIFILYILGKDAKTYRCTFVTNDSCMEWQRRLHTALTKYAKIEDFFAFAHFSWGSEEGQAVAPPPPLLGPKTMFQDEVERLGFDLTYTWRITNLNKDFSLCSSYPAELLLPLSIEEKVLPKLASFRSSRRIPAVVWRHRGNGCVIARCSQPEMGWMGWRNHDDERLIQDIGLACAKNGGTSSIKEESICLNDISSTDSKEKKKETIRTLILDARSYAAAFTNRAKGGGYECQEYYPNCEIQFMSLANIHSIRKSFQSLRLACAAYVEQPNWLSVLENTKWLQHISGLLKATLVAVNAIDREERPVVVHCSDGWDRTSQIVSLAELLLDPFYRTMNGFKILVEKEWLEFGHKFGDRCGNGLAAEDVNERSPVFLQFLDCVHQLIHQFPTAFEFNDIFLIKLVHHTYSCLFGTFLCNNSMERKKHEINRRTSSVWNFLQNNDGKFRNFLFMKTEMVLRPSCQMRDLVFWSPIYVQNFDPVKDVSGSSVDATGVPLSLDTEDTTESTSSSSSTKETSSEEVSGGVGSSLPKTRSWNDLSDHQAVERQRRLSDPHSLPDNFRGSLENLSVGHTNGDELDGETAPEDYDSNTVNPNQSTLDNCVDDNMDVNNSDIHVHESENASFVNSVCVDHASDSEEHSSALTTVGQTKVIETSTDTLIGDLSLENKPDLGNCDLKSIDKLSALKNEGIVHVSTSTTDLSDSRVEPSCCNQNGVGMNAKVLSNKCQSNHCPGLPTNYPIHLPPNSTCSVGFDVSLLNGSCANGHTNALPSTVGTNVCFPKYGLCPNTNGVMTNGRQKRVSTEANIETLKQLNCSSNLAGSIRSPSSNHITPLHSRTPSYGYPTTPCEDRNTEVLPARILSSTSSTTATATTTPSPGFVERKLDTDGLTLIADERQQQLYELILEKQNVYEQYHKLLSIHRQLLCQQVCQRCNTHSRGGTEALDEVCSQPDSVGSCCSEPQSVGQESYAASEEGWEKVDAPDLRPNHLDLERNISDEESNSTRCCCRNCNRFIEGSNQDHFETYLDAVKVCSKCYKELHCRQQVLLDPRVPKSFYSATPGSSN